MLNPRDGANWRPVLVVIVLLLGPLLAGCSRTPEPTYSAGAVVENLPAAHQEQIAQGLLRLFGTPSNPYLRIPSDEEEEVTEEEEDAEEEVTEEEEDAASGPALIDAIDPDRLKRGAAVFNRRCAGCHGVTGDGNGEAAATLQPKPRDYRRGIFKFTSTPYGAKPTRNDLTRIIRHGAKGTSMPAFPWLSDDDLDAVVDYVIMLSHRGEVERYVAEIAEFDYEEGDEISFLDFADGVAQAHEAWGLAESEVVMPTALRPAYDDASILEGRRAFLSRGCAQCHGENGRGQTEWLSREFLAQQEAAGDDEKIKINYDAWGDVAPAADLSARMLHGGRRPIDVFRRIYTGINGTPMPAFGDALAEEPETLWHLTHYILSIIDGRDVEGLDEIRATAVQDSSTDELQDSATGEPTENG